MFSRLLWTMELSMSARRASEEPGQETGELRCEGLLKLELEGEAPAPHSNLGEAGSLRSRDSGDSIWSRKDLGRF